MRTSESGIAFLERHEGVVLRAYRDPVGIWTIGAGLTAASGVVRPVAGMTLSPEEATRLLALALRSNYEPAVARAIGDADPAQHAFDAAVSFHFNTGAIGRASWVRAWRARDWPAVRDAIMAWRRAGGRVLSGLVRRREEEYRLLRHGDYGTGAPVRAAPAEPAARARIVAPVTSTDIPAIRAALAGLGHAVGSDPGAIAASAVRAFQSAHGLTVDGIVGRATASTLQRVVDARRKAMLPAAIGAAGIAETIPEQGAAEALAGLPWAGELAVAAAALRALWLVWQYRDAIAPALDDTMPRLASWLRSL